MNPKGLFRKDWFSRAILISCIMSALLALLLVSKIDGIIHGQLYNYGLEFSNDWASPYWTLTSLLYVSLGLFIALSATLIATSFTPKIAKEVAYQRTVIPKTFRHEEKLLHPIAEKNELKSELQTELLPETTTKTKIEAIPQTELAIETLNTKVAETQPTQEPVLEMPLETTKVEESIQENKPQPINDASHNILVSCPNCRKVFSRPLLMLDFSGGKTRVVNICPYCNQILGSEDNIATQEQDDDVQIADLDEEKVSS